ncbi:cingulin-like protein 1 [Sinocyclocheilus anshuiensis]|uniref:cingulin-like protein 1 n=1 Tax=Sinocyclocheilus anshuiensis TaxID=1608454 RepID=UPI0007B8B4B8|nr:PREDICTED: cingulin-like protein 1 [Sinocyclocheilus anshuiensis]
MRHESREREKSQNPVSGELSEPKTQEASEQERHGAEKKSDDEQKAQHSKDKPDASDPGPHSNLNGEKQHSSPQSEDEPTTPKVRPNPKYQLYLGSNGTSGSNGTLLRVSPVIRGSMESLSSRDGDSMSDRTGGFESPPRVFNSPYSTLSLDYNPFNRMSDFKTQEVMSPTVSEMNLFGLNRSVSPVNSPALNQRTRVPGYDSLTRRRDVSLGCLINAQLKFECNMEKERNQIRFEMRGLLVNNEDLLRTNTQMQGETNRLREKIVELESNNNVLQERFRQMEAREVMVEANTQEYAFNFLQQTLKNKIQDTEEALEKQAQHAQTVSEKLWLTERNLEELELEKETKAKKTLELSSTVFRLETELQTLGQSRDELSKQLKLAQEKVIDLEGDLEELQENEQRWASKHKRAVDQSEQLQMKLIQEKDLNDQLECEKAILERQLRDLRTEMEELQNNRVEVDSITRAEIKAKELENALRAEERNKVVMSNTISKLEKKIHELSEQMEEEHKISTEQRELQCLPSRRKESRQTLENLKLHLSEDDDEEDQTESTEKQITQV